MTTIEEESEMDFINWDTAATGTSSALPATSEGAIDSIDAVPDMADGSNMDLVFSNVDGDDWSFWALEHYESTQIQQNLDVSAYADMTNPPPTAPQLYWETPEAPCINCAQGGYQCKRIREGKYKGYCTSCVALRRGCSFGPATNNLAAEAGETFPANPWPTMGDRPATSILHEDELAAMISAAPPAPSLVAAVEDKPSSPKPQSMPKIGARFSRESVKVLKNWLSTHSRHPYPTDEEKDNLQKITGLNKTQITNWLANARRRGKIQPTRAVSPHVGRGYIQAMDIPQRKGTPGPFESMNPLQRWANSPPENEPASVTAIARAVSASNSYSTTSGSGRNSPYISNFSDDGSSRSLCNQSSASSLGTSHSSGGSFASAFSNQSRGSFGSLPSFARSNRGRRRRRRAPLKRNDETSSQPLKTFQCTFCTETFRTKHDWQRHEKSLHLSLERWICSPEGPKCVHPETSLMSCVFCGEANPDENHVESHNFSGCTERTIGERTFYRKDHLRQHLRLVHSVKFLPWAMDKWKVASPEIRSRCGFCGIVLDSWTIRVDHLAEHFKTGNTMADWKGDWGFDEPVLEMVENSIPPYLIHDQQKSSSPASAGHATSWTPNNAYDLLKTEMQHWIDHRTEMTGKTPSDPELQQEACRVILAAELQSKDAGASSPSWLRDLVMSSTDATRNALSQPVPGQSEIHVSPVRGNGKSDIFERCEFERQLQDYVLARQMLGLTAMDHELQLEACRILGRTEEKSSDPAEKIANWLLRLINSSPVWLQDFRRRAYLPRSEDVGDAYQRSKDPTTIDSTIHNFSRLDSELGEFLQYQRSLGIEPADAVLQRQARIIVYELEDEWNQTAADDKEWLEGFRQRYPPKSARSVSASSGSPTHGQVKTGTKTSPSGSGSRYSNMTDTGIIIDADDDRRLARGLSRFVASTMSANNPNCHIPTDQELQHQARWIVYDDDDPWNYTAADNAEWLQRFKVDVGIFPQASEPDLPSTGLSWAPVEGETGFTPSHIAPDLAATFQPLEASSAILLPGAATPFETNSNHANRLPQTSTQAYPALADTLCSRELENGLTEFVRRELHRTGIFPSDDQLQERARAIMGMQRTPCDDPVLLGKFKATLQGAGTIDQSWPIASDLDLGAIVPISPSLPTTSALTAGLAALSNQSLPLDPLSTGMDLDLAFTEQEINDIMQDTSLHVGDNTQSDNSQSSNTGVGGSGLQY
ncbi:hypothetical protein F5Y15DRAFT_394433 [Xylariaceae sp. FL0016]|nr:hypothetical protein F5Y15DRAFT_394433 [Xylariaceae sp. FL0016]